MTEKAGRHGDEGQQRRLVWVQIVLCAIALLLVGRLAWYQLFGRIVSNPQDPETIPAVRGSIRDATGHYLATATYACNVFFRPDIYDQPEAQMWLRERMAVTAAMVASGMPVPDDKAPAGYVPAFADLLVKPGTREPKELASNLANGLADRDALVLALVDEMSDASTQVAGNASSGTRSGRRHGRRFWLPSFLRF